MATSAQEAPKKIVIVGRDAPLWLSAGALIRATRARDFAIEIIELPALARPSEVIPTQPPLQALHRILGIDEHDMLRASRGSYSLGQNLVSFMGTGSDFFLPFGEHGHPFEDIPFVQHWVRARASGLSVSFSDFSLNAAAAKYGRFFIPDRSSARLHETDYAYHVGACEYGKFLRAKVESDRARIRSTSSFSCLRDPDSGTLTSIILDDGTALEADLFVDVTGSQSLLLSGQPRSQFHSWRRWLPFDRSITVGCNALDPLPAYAQAKATSLGVLHMTPIQDMTSLTLTFDGRFGSDADMAKSALVLSGMSQIENAVAGEVVVGHYNCAWSENVVGLGQAYAGLDLIGGLDLHLLHHGIVQLVTILSAGEAPSQAAEAYNRTMSELSGLFLTFQSLFYKFNTAEYGRAWEAIRAVELPLTGEHMVRQFLDSGIVAAGEPVALPRDAWLAALIGLGLQPAARPDVDAGLSDAVAMEMFVNLLQSIARTVKDMPSHAAYLEMHVPLAVGV